MGQEERCPAGAGHPRHRASSDPDRRDLAGRVAANCRIVRAVQRAHGAGIFRHGDIGLHLVAARALLSPRIAPARETRTTGDAALDGVRCPGHAAAAAAGAIELDGGAVACGEPGEARLAVQPAALHLVRGVTVLQAEADAIGTVDAAVEPVTAVEALIGLRPIRHGDVGLRVALGGPVLRLGRHRHERCGEDRGEHECANEIVHLNLHPTLQGHEWSSAPGDLNPA